jgi:hypothetical protein
MDEATLRALIARVDTYGLNSKRLGLKRTAQDGCY